MNGASRICLLALLLSACALARDLDDVPPAPDGGASDGGAPDDDVSVPRKITVISGEEDYCPDDVTEGLPCDAAPTTYWWCTHRKTCDIWACAPESAGAAWVVAERAPDVGCTLGCPNDFDAAVAEMDYCQGMICLEQVGATCRELRCLSGWDFYELVDVDCP